MQKVYVIGTFDTKGPDLDYVAALIEGAGQTPWKVDVSTSPSTHPVDVSSEEVARHHPSERGFHGKLDDRGQAVQLMSDSLCEFLVGQNDLRAVIGLGGSGGTALVAAAMRRLPIGVPKLMVSTVASGDVRPYVGASDITMVYSVTDVAGINSISRVILGNAAHAIAGMAANSIPEAPSQKKPVAITMFGVTTPCVTQVRDALAERYDPLVFHATGTGGQSMEKLIDSGLVSHVIDITTTEVCDFHMGGVFSAGEDRFGSVIRRGIPYVGSVGALDMVNFAAMPTVPEKYRGRNLYVHNANVTLMRTTAEENRVMGTWIAEKLNQMIGPVRFLIPERGVSLIDAEGQPFYDAEADRVLFETIEEAVVQTEARKVMRLPYHINDAEFASALVTAFEEIHE